MSKIIHLLLADDDDDDRFFFAKALKTMAIKSNLKTVDDGERLMAYLVANSHQLPDALFLDLNMPRKNGSECLIEIKRDDRLKQLPVIIYSTSLHEELANLLYKDGAHYYMRKNTNEELERGLHWVLTLLAAERYERPTREHFILKPAARLKHS